MIRSAYSSTEQLWRMRLRRFQSSGMSVTRFCEREGVSVPSFYQWRKRLAVAPATSDVPTFVPVRLTPSAVVEIHLPNGARICVPLGDAEILRVAIETAGRLTNGGEVEVEVC